MNKPHAPSAIGTQADTTANVNIERVFGGYFGSEANANIFCEIGISSIEHNLPKNIVYADFGGGQGMLAKTVRNFLEHKSHHVKTTVVDGNQGYLESASKNELKILLDNLEVCELEELANLITMRAVLHYNNSETQIAILNNVAKNLHSGGYFVHQVSSGTEENSRLRSQIVNIPSLGRAGCGNYHWTSVDETLALHARAGFIETALVGDAPPCAWSAEDQWERFNGKALTEAKAGNDEKVLTALLTRQEQYLHEAHKLIKKTLLEFGSEKTGIEEKSDGTYKIHYRYPIIVSRK